MAEVEQVSKEPNMIANGSCYVNDRIYQKDQKFFYDGPEGRAFHRIDSKPMAKINFDALMNRAVASATPSGELEAAQKLASSQAAEIAALKQSVANLQAQFADLQKGKK